VRLAFVSPMPPSRSGVADYAAGLVGALRRRAAVEVTESPGGGCDNVLYQLGNNHLHWPAYRAALERPGVAVLHDAVLNHLLLGSLDESAYVEEFVYHYGEWLRDLGRQLWRSRSRSGADPRYFEYTMLRRVVERSRAVVVHNPGARRRALQASPAARVVEVPHYFTPPRPDPDPGETRRRLGLGGREILVATFGYLRESKRIGSVLKAMQAVPGARFLLAGQFVSQDLERALHPQLRAGGVIRFGHRPEPDFWRLAAAADICVNLRWPSAGETSGIGIKLMGIGKPVLVTAGEETTGFPELSVIPIDPGEAEVDMLAHYLRLLAADEDLRREIGRRAADHIAAHHSLEQAASLYLEAARAST